MRITGIYGVYFREPLNYALAVLAIFGALPLLILLVWRSEIYTYSLLVRFSVIYGVTYFILTSALGTQMYRLIGYAWPLPLLALLILMERAAILRKGARFVATNSAICASMFYHSTDVAVDFGIILYVIAIICFF